GRQARRARPPHHRRLRPPARRHRRRPGLGRPALAVEAECGLVLRPPAVTAGRLVALVEGGVLDHGHDARLHEAARAHGLAGARHLRDLDGAARDRDLDAAPGLGGHDLEGAHAVAHVDHDLDAVADHATSVASSTSTAGSRASWHASSATEPASRTSAAARASAARRSAVSRTVTILTGARSDCLAEVFSRRMAASTSLAVSSTRPSASPPAATRNLAASGHGA